ncbi:MAG: mechanosensitive ion channel [Planctomycetes bacterium]|nr:mechanosensitive ion channel [Planctomycetota bacterium]
MLRFPTILLLFAAVLAPALRTQTPPPAQDQANELSVAAVQARLDAAAADGTLPAETKTPLLETLGRALESARQLEARRQTIERLAAQRSGVPERLQQRRDELAALDAQKPGPPQADLELPALEQGYATAQLVQTEAQKAATDVEAERGRRAERRAAIPTAVAETRAKLDALPTQPPDAAGAEPRLAAARRLAFTLDRARLQAELDALAAELQTYDAEADLLRTEADLAARRATAAKASATAWLEVLQPKRAEAARRAEEAARLAALMADPRLAGLADGNAELARAIALLATKRQAAEGDRAERDRERAELQRDFDEIKQKVDLVGLTDAVGVVLRHRRTQLADTSRRHQLRTRNRADRIADAQLQNLEFDQRRTRLVEDPDGWLAQQLGVPDTAALPPELLTEARRLRDSRRDLLQQLAEGYHGLLGTEISAQSGERQITDLIATYRAFVAERVLGIPSSAPLWRHDWDTTAAAAAWLAQPGPWLEAARTLGSAVVADVWPLALALPLLLLLALRRLLARRLAVHGERAARGSNVAYAPTTLAAIDTALLALPLPALLWLGAARLGAAAAATDFDKALAVGLVHTAWSLLLVTALAAIVRARGLAEAHFAWSSASLAQLRRAIPLLLLAVLPFTLVLALLEAFGDDSRTGALGSLALLGQLALLLVVFARLLHHRRGIVGGGAASGTMLFRLRHLWHAVGVGVPLALLGMVVSGYDYTALQLARRLHLTIAVVAAAVFGHAMIVRSLALERRRLQMRKAEQRMQAVRTGDTAVAAEAPALAELDPQSLARQTQTLLRGAITIVVAVAVFQIWVDVLPALGALRGVELWNIGDEAAPQWISLADVLLGVFLFGAALVAARNLPALLELFVLQRLRMQAGERHAITTLARYGIFIVGLVWAFSSIGIGWSKVQWLVAAVSVGLGFGLQEIFANFVSGLILLFERPIRVGDIVRVGDTTGRVTRIQIRATTIQDWERKELVVPNREFVTGRFVNWTLGDSIVRWSLPVGTAYGTDTDRALQLLEQIARASRHVRADPVPEAVCTGFGDSTINLELRLFVDMNALEYRWMTELYQGIDRAFREAGIEIAFPQRDVNLKLSQQLVDLLRPRAAGA